MEHAEAKAIGVKHVNLIRGMDMIAGLVLMASTAFTNDQVSGLANIITALLVMHLGMIPTFGGIKAPFLAWVSLLLGLWTIILPWGLGIGIAGVSPTAKLVNVLCGIVITVCAGRRALCEPRPELHDDITPPEGSVISHH